MVMQKIIVVLLLAVTVVAALSYVSTFPGEASDWIESSSAHEEMDDQHGTPALREAESPGNGRHRAVPSQTI